MRVRTWVVSALLALGACVSPALKAAPAAASHPLDPLTSGEIEAAVGILRARGKLGEGTFLSLLVLREPSKAAVRAFTEGASLEREAFAVVLDRPRNRTSEALIDLGKNALSSWKDIPGVQPNVFEEEFTSVPKVVRQDPRWREAMKKRGIEDFENVLVDTWAAGVLPSTAPPGARLSRALSFYKGDRANGYGRPIEGVIAVVDLNRMAVVEVVDTGVRPLPPPSQNLDAVSLGKTRKALKPLAIEQAEGPSFVRRGQEVRWDNWSFRWALHPREGLVLYTVGYEDGGRVRPILYRASISEMVVPYGDPDVNWVFRNAFDEGEYGLGRLANELKAGRDVPANAELADAVLAGEDGKPVELAGAVAFYERDGGLLWTHYDDGTEKTYLRRGRQLVAAYVVTVGNYDYILNWIFSQDGTIEVRAEASGILLGKGVAQKVCESCAKESAEGDEKTGAFIAERIVAPNHQHFFSFRLDFDVDGEANSVAELDVESAPADAQNPFFNAFAVKKKVLATEAAAQRDLDAKAHRHWKVFNPTVKTALGHYPGYLLAPGENTVPYMLPQATTRKRAGFINHHVWVTPFKPEEMYAAGDYPNQHPGGDGLPRWTADDEPVVNRDVVLWYTVGLTHAPRPEEWPIMPTAGVGFKLLPAGFFTRNPALDVPEPAGER